jgi:CUB/sushi domain-containing protein
VSISSGSSIERLHGTTVIRDRLTSASYPVGSQLKYRCERGHVLDGRRRVVNRVCTKNGDWTGKEPSCTHVDCGMPDLVDNGEFRLQNNATAFGSMVFYECEVGWKLEGFDKRSCQSSGRWEPEGPKCKETLCPMLEQPSNTIMNLTTLRIGGKAVFKCEHGFKLIGDPDINCLSSGSWSAWPPSCVEIDCGEPYTVENSRMFLVNESTRLGSVVEYLCVPGYTREGPFQRTCEISGYWSGQDPKCYIPRKLAVTPLVGGNSRPYQTGGSPSQGKDKTDNSGIGVWIGVGLGLIVVIGLLVVGIYFYRKQMALQSKPTRDSNANGLGVLGIPSYAVQSYSGQIGARPPPPIQMYSIDDSPEDHRGPIYDTINDDNSSHSQSTYSQSSDSAYPRSTFTPGQGQNGSPPGAGGQANNGYANDYDVPEGNERPGSRGNSSVGTVTINGIAV